MSPEGAERVAQMQAMRNDGMKLSEIAAHFGISATRVWELTVNPKPRQRRGDPIRTVDGLFNGDWTKPGPELLAICHEARDEIRRNWVVS